MTLLLAVTDRCCNRLLHLLCFHLRVTRKPARDDYRAIKVNLFREKRVKYTSRAVRSLKNYIRRKTRTMYYAHTVSNPFPLLLSMIVATKALQLLPAQECLCWNSAYETTVLKAKLSYLYTILSFSTITLRLKLGYENRSRNLATAPALTVEELGSWFFT